MTRNPLTIQEVVRKDRHYPWRVLVVCVLLNQTHGRGVRPMIDEFFRRVPEPEDMLTTNVDTIDDLLQPLGFHNKRFTALYRMTYDYIHGRPYNEMYAVGPYALDALDLFVHGKTDGLDPRDGWLKSYHQWRKEGGPAVEWDKEGHVNWRNRNGIIA